MDVPVSERKDPLPGNDVSEVRSKAGTVAVFPRSPHQPIDRLPLALTSFIGREREIAEVKSLLAERRLLTLCGPGGRARRGSPWRWPGT